MGASVAAGASVEAGASVAAGVAGAQAAKIIPTITNRLKTAKSLFCFILLSPYLILEKKNKHMP
jgi:hypothetical protein